MDDRSFEKLDKQFMEGMKPLREEKVPEHLLKGFKDAVWEKARAQRTPAPAPRARRVGVPLWAPVFAVLVLGVALVLKIPSQGQLPAVTPTVYLAQADPADVSEEVAALRELGVWTEEDELASGVEELSTDELEALETARNGDTALA